MENDIKAQDYEPSQLKVKYPVTKDLLARFKHYNGLVPKEESIFLPTVFSEPMIFLREQMTLFRANPVVGAIPKARQSGGQKVKIFRNKKKKS